ncbi:MAG TPA: hypothetical protein VEK76_09390 [Candidatus Binatia bacterium]|nr:hypothetical protein [Candidatus Binatia bacterium]
MTEIEVLSGPEGGFQVRAQGRSFAVTAPAGLAAELGAPDPESLVRASFEFLLAREPAGSILSQFDLTVIQRYFPEWRHAMRERFA